MTFGIRAIPMASPRSTTLEDRFTVLEVSNHSIQLKLEYNEEVSRLRNDMATLLKVVAQLICDNNNEVFDEALAKLCQTCSVREYQTKFEQ